MADGLGKGSSLSSLGDDVMLPEGTDRPPPGLGLGNLPAMGSKPLVSQGLDRRGEEGRSQVPPGSERHLVRVRGPYIAATTYSVQGTAAPWGGGR